MTKLRYLVKIGTNPAKIYFYFHPKSKIILGVEIDADHIELNQVRWVLTNSPSSEKDLLDNFKHKTGKVCHITYVPEKFEFEDFWNKYGSKVGNKPRAKKLWGLLPEGEQVSAMAGIDQYNAFLRQNPNLTKAYPETYLSQERWKN